MGRPRLHASNAARQAAYEANKKERENDEARIRAEARSRIPSALDQLRQAITEAAQFGDSDAKLLRGLETHEQLTALAKRFEDRAEELRRARAAARSARKVS